jgi:amino acid adenylation domain-containing protein
MVSKRRTSSMARIVLSSEGVRREMQSGVTQMSKTLHSWISEAADRAPTNEAVVGEDVTMTYGDIEEYSSRLAATLRAHGCRKGDRVAIAMPTSARAVASLIGVLKAGCAYVPLDLTGALSRVAQMIDQCEPKAVLFAGCGPQVVDNLEVRGALRGSALGWLDGSAEPPPAMTFASNDVWGASPDGALARVTEHDLAYILFTSGTTGSPKGVPITHGNVRAFIGWAIDYFGLGPRDRLSGHTALTFDLSTFDVYATFAAGASLHHVPSRVRMMPHQVADFIEERELTLWFSVPSQLAYVARFHGLEARHPSSLRHVAWCGDVLHTPSLCYWKRHLPGVAFTNLYGPTETTVASSYHRVPDDFDDPNADVPIGIPLPGEELLVLDDELRRVPPGEVGDIYIKGVGLSVGYWRDPERTAAAFLPAPGANGDGARMYRTGDRGRLQPDGTVAFLGRSDFQIKTNGYRVEPAEVENAILQLDEVAACAVVPLAAADFSGTVIGCAYVSSNGHPLRAAEVKKRLGDRLPSYMIPSRWLVLEDLPVDTRGKVDRGRARALLGG